MNQATRCMVIAALERGACAELAERMGAAQLAAELALTTWKDYATEFGSDLGARIEARIDAAELAEQMGEARVAMAILGRTCKLEGHNNDGPEGRCGACWLQRH